MEELHILVVGGTNVGKSTVAEEIRRHLAAKGFGNVTFKDPEHLDGYFSPDKQDARITNLAGRDLKVNIETVQTRRNETGSAFRESRMEGVCK